jgi:hypothetical protein
MFELRFMQKPIVQMIVLVLAILFIFDMGYRLFLEKSYYLQPAKDGAVYRIDKRSGEVYLVYMDKMRRVEDVTPTDSRNVKFNPYLKYGSPKVEDIADYPGKQFTYTVDWTITFIIVFIFICINILVWMHIHEWKMFSRKKRDSLLP